MAKRRTISQELCHDEEFNSLSIEAQLIFLRMLSVSDDCGVVPESKLVALINPPKKIAPKVLDFVEEITKAGLGVRFSFKDKPFFAFKQASFKFWQSHFISRRVKSEYLRIGVDEFKELIEAIGSHRKASDAFAEGIDKDKRLKIKDERLKTPTYEEVCEFVESVELPPSDGDYFFHKCEGNGWTNGGKPIKDWKATIRAWKAAGYMPSQKAQPRSGPGPPHKKSVGMSFEDLQREMERNARD